MGLDDAIAAARRGDAERTEREREARRPASSYPADLASVIADFLRRGAPTDDSYLTGEQTGGRRSMLRAHRRPKTVPAWDLFKDIGEGWRPGTLMILTQDGLLRVPRSGEGFQPIGELWSGWAQSPTGIQHLSLADGSLTAAVTEVLARKVIAAGKG